MTSPPLNSVRRKQDGRISTIIYLDQNKWIDLARAATAPSENPELRKVLEHLCAEVEARRVLLPLTTTNLIETQKINRSEQRFHLAYTQVTLSGARVFRGHQKQITIEIGRILSQLYDLEWSEPEPLWFLSNLFFESVAEYEDRRLGFAEFPKAVEWMRSQPQRALLQYLHETPENIRVEAIRKFTQGCEDLRRGIEDRRSRHKAEALSMRRRIYSAITAIEQQELIIAIAAELGLPHTCLSDKNGATLRAVVRETPAFLVEREISLKLEAQDRPIALNDMRDMRTFCTVLPYADIIVAENQFINLARQAGLHSRYGAYLETDIRMLADLL
ncbi:hypothetical protein [Mesorhizobium sp. ZC-5]|uniref:hypothetical protein n=1 Tax=Mesorhizobium sp. ZC-5 TaxID=2986066 RepID=UPI0021E86610|nr:hypothetical protein [Mesorhizobium sp. ZC-5]MCV3238736.1 hypothetical protein [Mesorhizobium sp. ZC-5]